MKQFFLFGCIYFSVGSLMAQKYVLLDKHMANKPKFVNTITLNDKVQNFIPVERKYLASFVKSVENIAAFLDKNDKGKVKDYDFGCLIMRGRLVPLQNVTRLDYVITSTCENINIEMHLCDAKMANKNNFFFINTWLKYIKSNLGKYL